MKYSKFTLLRLYWFSFNDRGVVLPIAIGLGFIAVLVGTIMLTRSFRDQTSVEASQSAEVSQALAELGVTRYLDLINNFRAIASVPACGGSWNGNNCNNPNPPNLGWDATNGTPEPLGGTFSLLNNLINEVANPTNTFPATVQANNIPLCATTPVTTVQSFANRSWRNRVNNLGDEQFRLINYDYEPNSTNANPDPNNVNDNIGTLTVEGRVRKANAPRQWTTKGTTRLQVTFPVVNQPPWGLWIQQTGGLEIPPPTGQVNAEVNAEVKDSGCANNGTEQSQFATLVNQLRGIQVTNRNYISTPQKLFPGLPQVPSPPANNQPLPEPDKDGNRNVGSGNYNSRSLKLSESMQLIVDAPGKNVQILLDEELLLTGDASILVKRGTKLLLFIGNDQAEGNYQVSFNDNSRLIVEPNSTVQIAALGSISVKGEGRKKPAIELEAISQPKDTPGKLIFYANSDVSLAGNSKVINHNTRPDYLQIYTYLEDGGNYLSAGLRLTDSSVLSNVFIFARNAPIIQEGESQITGTIWARSWQGRNVVNNGVKFTQGIEPDFNQLDIVTNPSKADNAPPAPTLESISTNTIGNISSWRRCQVNTAVDCQP